MYRWGIIDESGSNRRGENLESKVFDRRNYTCRILYLCIIADAARGDKTLMSAAHSFLVTKAGSSGVH